MKYTIEIDNEIDIPKDFIKHLKWGVADILMCSEQFIKINYDNYENHN